MSAESNGKQGEWKVNSVTVWGSFKQARFNPIKARTIYQRENPNKGAVIDAGVIGIPLAAASVLDLNFAEIGKWWEVATAFLAGAIPILGASRINSVVRRENEGKVTVWGAFKRVYEDTNTEWFDPRIFYRARNMYKMEHPLSHAVSEGLGVGSLIMAGTFFHPNPVHFWDEFAYAAAFFTPFTSFVSGLESSLKMISGKRRNIARHFIYGINKPDILPFDRRTERIIARRVFQSGDEYFIGLTPRVINLLNLENGLVEEHLVSDRQFGLHRVRTMVVTGIQWKKRFEEGFLDSIWTPRVQKNHLLQIEDDDPTGKEAAAIIEARTLRRQLETSQVEVRRLTGQLSDRREEVGRLQTDLQTAKSRLGTLGTEKAAIEKDLRGVRSELTSLKDLAGRQETELDQLRPLVERVRVAEIECKRLREVLGVKETEIEEARTATLGLEESIEEAVRDRVLLERRVTWLEDEIDIALQEMEDYEKVLTLIHRGADINQPIEVRHLEAGGMGITIKYYVPAESRFVVKKKLLLQYTTVEESVLREEFGPGFKRKIGEVLVVKEGHSGLYEFNPIIRNKEEIDPPDSGVRKKLVEFFESIQTAKDSFFNEVRALARLQGRNVVAGRWEQIDGSIIMDYVVGRSLTSLMYQPMPTREVLIIARQIVQALNSLREAGIETHRDLKPGNVMLQFGKGPDDDDWVKVIDYGTVKLPRHLSKSALTRGMFQLTPRYAPPERFQDNDNENMDVWSLGIMIFEMLTGGTSPYVFADENDGPAVYKTIKDKPVNDAITDTTEIPEKLYPMLLGMIERDKDDRYSLNKTEQEIDLVLGSL